MVTYNYNDAASSLLPVAIISSWIPLSQKNLLPNRRLTVLIQTAQKLDANRWWLSQVKY